MSKLILVLLLVATFRGAASGEWTRFRGPNGTGVSAATGVPVEFGPANNVAWKTAVPPGHSSPVLTDRHIFLTAHTPEKESYRLLVLALDRRTGAIVWQREVPRARKGRLQNVNGAASPSVVTDGQNVYAFFQEFGLISYTAEGRERWRMPLGPFNVLYGFGASPILVGETLILSVDQDLGSYLLAVDPRTGRRRWKVDRPHVISGYSTPTVYRPKDGPAQIVIPESFQLTAYSVIDGARIWWVRGLACEMKSVASYDREHMYINGWGFPINQPGEQVPTVTFADGLKQYDANGDGAIGRDEIRGEGKLDRVLSPKYGYDTFDLNRNARLDAREWDVMRAMLAAENGLLAIRMGGRGDRTESAIRWRYQRPVPQVPSTLLYNGVLFMVNDSGILLSLDPNTGDVLKRGRLKGAVDKYFASPVGADGKVWLVSQDGTVSVVSAKADWDVLAANKLDEEVFATPAIADGRIFVRTRSTLYAFGMRGHGEKRRTPSSP
jgi:outer membrane protein assembly factor BamB